MRQIEIARGLFASEGIDSAAVERILRDSFRPSRMSPEELVAEIERRMDEVYRLRRELSRKTGDEPSGVRQVDFGKYVTD